MLRLLVVVRLLALLAVATHALLTILRWYLLLRILHSSHGCWGSSLHPHWVALGAGRAVGLPRVGAALLSLGVRVIAHAV